MTNTLRPPLKPNWMLKPGLLKTLHDKGFGEYQKELKEFSRKAEIAYNKKRKERLEYLFKINYDQGNDRIMWPYDLAKMMFSCEETLQMCRETDYLYDYKRENQEYEYNPENFIEKYYPEYENFNDFENDNGSDYDDFYDDFFYYDNY